MIDQDHAVFEQRIADLLSLGCHATAAEINRRLFFVRRGVPGALSFLREAIEGARRAVESSTVKIPHRVAELAILRDMADDVAEGRI